MYICMSAGHGKYVRGARGNPVPPQLDEVDEARRVVTRTAEIMQAAGATVDTYFDDVSRTQNENLNRLVDWHNGRGPHDYDVSIHLNCYDGTAHGTEVLYVTQSELAEDVATAIARASGLTDRGGKYRSDLFWLNNTAAPAVLVECAFVDNDGDCAIWHDPAKFEAICQAIADSLAGEESIAPPADALLTEAEVEAICEAAAASSIARYSWRDRGVAPAGYLQGIAVAYGTVVRKFQAGYSAAIEMSRANSDDEDVDALAWYDEEFLDLGMANDRDGLNTLRHLWVLLMGLGMRESSGRHCEGRDQSASNTTSDTAEAGLFQSSWNFHNSSDEIDKLFDAYSSDDANCYQAIFAEGVSCTSSEWASYGSGDGKAYQDLAKACPAFACESTAVGLRTIRQHWGPINRREVELREEADQLYMQIEAILQAGEPIEPPIEPPAEVAVVEIKTTGNVQIVVNGQPVEGRRRLARRRR